MALLLSSNRIWTPPRVRVGFPGTLRIWPDLNPSLFRHLSTGRRNNRRKAFWFKGPPIHPQSMNLRQKDTGYILSQRDALTNPPDNLTQKVIHLQADPGNHKNFSVTFLKIGSPDLPSTCQEHGRLPPFLLTGSGKIDEEAEMLDLFLEAMARRMRCLV